jgi:hypothetical protein
MATQRLPQDPRNRRRPWHLALDGEWWLVRDAPDGAWTGDDYENNAVRVAARQWAARRGYRAETRTGRGGKELYVRFTKR